MRCIDYRNGTQSARRNIYLVFNTDTKIQRHLLNGRNMRIVINRNHIIYIICFQIKYYVEKKLIQNARDNFYSKFDLLLSAQY